MQVKEVSYTNQHCVIPCFVKINVTFHARLVFSYSGGSPLASYFKIKDLVLHGVQGALHFST